MTLFSLARKNVMRNVSSYGLYIASMIFAIVIYFTFVTLKYSDDIYMLTKTNTRIDGIMNASSIVLICFVAIFIFYSNSFFMKKRKKEVALYSLLGVRKRKIGIMLFFENMMIGLLALVAGMLIGFLLSKGLLTILVQLMGYSVVADFVFSPEAVKQTVIIFMLLFTVTSLQGYRVIYQFSLIDLFHASKKGEPLPSASAFSVFSGVVLLAIAYYLSLTNIFTSKLWQMMGYLTVPIVVITLTILGTFLLFNSVTVYALLLLKKMRNWSWKGLNVVTTSQLLYRIRANAKSLTIISILSATTITAGGAVYSIYYMTGETTKSANPNTFMSVGEPLDVPNEEKVYEAHVPYAELELLGKDGQTYRYTAISRSEYEQLATLQQKEAVNGEYVLLSAYYSEDFSDMKAGATFTNASETITIDAITTEQVLNGFVGMTMLVVPDAQFASMEVVNTAHVYAYENEKEQQELSEQLAAQLDDEANFSSFPRDYAASIAGAGSLLFVGSFLGLVFLTATGSIIYFKVLTEAEEDRDKYAILRKIGVSKRMMLKTIAQQVGFTFTLPLMAGLAHGAAALSAFSQLFMMDVTKPVLVWMALYVAVYALYYVFTVWNFYKLTKRGIV